MIDIKELYSILEKEKRTNQKLIKLPENYIKKIKTEIEKLEKQLYNLDKDSEEYRQYYRNLENIKALFYDLLMVRFMKILSISELEIKNNMQILDQSLLQDFEIDLYNIIKTLLLYIKDFANGKEVEKDILVNNLEKILKKEKLEKNYSVILIANDFNNKLIGPNNKLYGPFKKNDIIIVNRDFGDKLEKASLGKKIL